MEECIDAYLFLKKDMALIQLLGKRRDSGKGFLLGVVSLINSKASPQYISSTWIFLSFYFYS